MEKETTYQRRDDDDVPRLEAQERCGEQIPLCQLPRLEAAGQGEGAVGVGGEEGGERGARGEMGSGGVRRSSVMMTGGASTNRWIPSLCSPSAL